MSRKFLFPCVTLAAGMLVCSCGNGKKGPVLNKGVPENTAATVALKTDGNEIVDEEQENPEYRKLEDVLERMTGRFKSEVKIEKADYDAFLNDLHAVLEEAENCRADDLSLLYLIDKTHKVGENYVPKGLVKVTANEHYNVSRNDLSLRPDAEKALTEMADAALEDGIKLMVSSTYRSYEYQKNLFARYVAQDGEEEASRYSARPGTSQHQLGAAIDFGSITDDFALTKMGKWLSEHSEQYGWSLSFPKDHEDVTGFMWECWHYRYIGVKACAMQKKWFCDVQQYMFEFIDEWRFGVW